MKFHIEKKNTHKLAIPTGKFSDGWFRCTYCSYETQMKVPEGRIPLCPRCEHRMEKM